MMTYFVTCSSWGDVINDMQLTCDSLPETLGAGGFVDPEVIFSGHSRSGERVC